jgi:RecA-family ATPase
MDEQVRVYEEPIPIVKEWLQMVKNTKPRSDIVEQILPDEPGEFAVGAGRTGIGKTNLALGMSFSIAAGTPFLGFKCKKAPVFYFAFEGDNRNLASRLAKLVKAYPDTGDRLRFEHMPIKNPRELYDDVFTRCSGAQVIVLDPVKYLLDGDAQKPNDVQKFITKLKESLIDLKATAILVIHIRKPQSKNSLIRPSDVYQIKGATEWVDSATTAIVLEKVAWQKKGLRLGFAKQRIAATGLPDFTVDFDPATCLFEKQGEVEIEEGDEGTVIRIPKH